MKYKSPIEIMNSPIASMFEEMSRAVANAVDGEVLKRVHAVGVAVDKEELIKALKYDRDQYVKGYAEAAAIYRPKFGKWIDPDADESITIAGRCSACGWEAHLYEDDVVGMPFCPNCGANMSGERNQF